MKGKERKSKLTFFIYALLKAAMFGKSRSTTAKSNKKTINGRCIVATKTWNIVKGERTSLIVDLRTKT